MARCRVENGVRGSATRGMKRSCATLTATRGMDDFRITKICDVLQSGERKDSQIDNESPVDLMGYDELQLINMSVVTDTL